jgi:autophagy-related protein 2
MPNDDLSPREETGTLLMAQWHRLLLAHAVSGENIATAILSVGPLSSIPVGSSPNLGSRPSPRPRVSVSQSSSRSSTAFAELTSLVLTVDIPSAVVKLPKGHLDGLQFLADDISKLTDRAFGSQPNSTASSQDPSLIGSRFFAKTRSSRGSTSDSTSTVGAQRADVAKETVIKVSVGEGK